MSVISVNTWLVRSFTHQYEILGMLGKVPIKIANQRVSDGLHFDILDYPKYGVIHASMDPFGLVSFTVESDAKNLEDESLKFMGAVKDVFIERIMKSIQHVSYNQIKEDLMPLSFHRIVLSKEFKPAGIQGRAAGSLAVYYDDQKVYSPDSAVYVQGSEDAKLLDALNYFSYTVLARNYVSKMVSIMSDLYRRANTVLKKIDKLDESASYSKEQLTTLKRSIVETDFIRRDCAERYGKIQQASRNFEHKEKAYLGERFSGDSEAVARVLEIDKAFEELKCDADYLVPLWRDVLIENLRNLSSAVNARVAFQESLEVKKEQTEVRWLRHITILGLAAALIKLGTTPSFNVGDLVIYGSLAVLFSLAIIVLVEYVSSKRK